VPCEVSLQLRMVSLGFQEQSQQSLASAATARAVPATYGGAAIPGVVTSGKGALPVIRLHIPYVHLFTSLARQLRIG
jgi:hypothetical protein